MPKSKSKSDVTSRRSIETSEVQREIDDDMFEVDKSIFIVTLINFQSLIRRIINNRYFRWFHLCLELIYFTLVLFYLYFVMEIEEDNSIVLISLMLSFLIICLVIYIMNIIDHWSDIRTLIDTALIAVAIGFDIYEITLRSDDKGYENGSKFGIYFNHDDLEFYRIGGKKNECITLIYDEPHFQFVHQLQNLYFALTGQELLLFKT